MKKHLLPFFMLSLMMAPMGLTAQERLGSNNTMAQPWNDLATESEEGYYEVQTPSVIRTKGKVAPSKSTLTVLYDQSQMVTLPGQGANGADASSLQEEQTLLGPNVNWAYGGGDYVLVADNFTLIADAVINEIEVYAYQTASGDVSTMTGMRLQIYDGNPMEGGQVVWGDNATNLMTSTDFTGIYRTTKDDPISLLRSIMSITASDLEISLPAGEYWLQWGLTGSMPNGPWGIPVCIPGQIATGDAVQKIDTGWGELIDPGSNEPLGMAMKISGYYGSAPTCKAPSNLFGSYTFNDESSYGTTLTWEEPDTMSMPLHHYNVYRSNSPNNFQVIAEVPADAPTTYFDELADHNGIYFYKVTAFYLDDNVPCESDPANASLDPTLQYVVISVTEINDNENTTKIYPNPTQGILNIIANGMTKVEIINTIGQIVCSHDTNNDEISIDLSTLEMGIYLVRISCTNGCISKQISVSR